MCELKIVKGTQTIGSRNFLLNIEADAFDGSKFEERSASGAIASFETNYIDNLNELIVNITATQAGSGTPSTPHPISGWSSCNVVRNGFNQWDEEWENGTFNTSTGANINTSSANNQIRAKKLIPVKSGSTMYVKTPVTPYNQGLWCIFYSDISTVLTGASISGNHGTDGNSFLLNNQSFVVPVGAKYMRFYLTNQYGATYNNDVTINYPSTDTSYHAYNGTTYTISLGDTYYDGTLNVTTGELAVTYYYVDMGSLTWTKVTGYPEFRADYSANNIPDGKHQAANVKSNLFCSIYQAMSTNETYRGANTGVSLAPTYISVGDSDPSYTDAATFTTAMSGVQLVYELATPTTVQLTPTEVRTLLNCNIFADTGDVVSCKYLVEVT